MEQALTIIKAVAEENERAILFHSASGKDSIALLHLMSPYFREIVCVYMYMVKDLAHINRYIDYAIKKYPNVRFTQTKHFARLSYEKNGAFGCVQNVNQRLWKLTDISEIVRKQIGIDWLFFGFKQSDSLNRRLMLRSEGYEQNAIYRKGRKCYPLSSYKNKDVIQYIEREGLICPERYDNGQSSGTNIADVNYLMWLRKNFPDDLKKVFSIFPQTERILYEHDYKTAKAERDGND